MNTKRRYSLVSAALAALALAGCAPDSQVNAKVQDNLREAARQALIGKTPDARIWADRAIAIDPKRQETYTGSPAADDANASMFFDQAPRISIRDIFTAVNDDPTLADYMRDATRKFPSDIDAWETLVYTEGRLGQYAQQKKDAATMAAQIEIAITKPKAKIDGRFLQRLGQAYFDAGDNVKGEANYRKAIATYSTDPIPQNALAYHYADVNDKAHLQEALGMANNALKLAQTQQTSQPDSQKVSQAAILDTIGWIQYRLGDYNSALKNLMDAVNGSDTVAGAPDAPELRYHMGMVYLAIGDKFGARTELRHALLLDHEYFEAEKQANLLQNVPPPPADPEDDAD